MKIGDLVKWKEYREIQLVPVVTDKVGVITSFGFYECRNNIDNVTMYV